MYYSDKVVLFLIQGIFGREKRAQVDLFLGPKQTVLRSKQILRFEDTCVTTVLPYTVQILFYLHKTMAPILHYHLK